MTQYELQADTKNLPFPKKLKKLLDMAPFIVSDDVQGQKISNDGKIVFGLRCASISYDLVVLIHEIAHFVEIDEKRMFKHMWGLKVPEKWLFGQWCIEPVTNQATMRELRVGAIQMNIFEWLGEKGFVEYKRNLFGDYECHHKTNMYSLEESIENFVDSMKYMPDWYLIPGKGDEKRKVWLTAKLKKFMKVYTIEWFLRRWEQRCEIVKRKVGK